MLMGIVTAHAPHTREFNRSTLFPRDEDPAFTTPNYFDPDPLYMPGGDGPMFRSGWIPDHCTERDRVFKAFSDAHHLAIACRIYLHNFEQGNNDGSSYNRYFARSSYYLVRDVIVSTFGNVERVNGQLVENVEEGVNP